MDKTYDPTTIENKWYQTWEENNYFAPQNIQNDNAKECYCIMIPPPNVTGSLHMGHGFQHSLMDTLIRYQRMQGKKTLWQVGTDHAGISTQMVVERRLAKEGIKRHDLGREKFMDEVWKWKQESGGNITQQMRRLGDSVDWTQERFTLDEKMSEAVKEVFVKLYDEGLIYRGKKLVNWDPHFCSAISDVEVINQEEDGHMWHIRYPIHNSDGCLVVATTRPETMLGDAAVAVHPDDERYKHLIGKQIALPLTNRTIPIIADDYVDPEFGSGCVKITPAHDFNDYEVGARHNLPKINIFTESAHLNDMAPEIYQGLERFEARKKIVADLETAGLMEKIEPHKLSVPRADRGNTIVEPYLTDQWFVKVEDLAKPALDAVKNDEIKFVPENWKNTYYQWMENIQDWCISRQLWWGHRIPAWYDAEGKLYVGHDEAEVRSKYKLADDLELKQDEDVLDTWFSSALWPFSTLGWPEKTDNLNDFYPTSVLITGFDIIFFWVARMIMMGIKFTGEMPFKEVYFTGLIRDSEGHKMSKTKGNVLDPIDLIDGVDIETLVNKRTTGLMQPWMAEKIEKKTRKEFPEGIAAHGTDALRFTFCALATTGRDIRFDMSRLDGYRNFCNKLWNAARYVFMQMEDADLSGSNVELSLADQWIQSRLQHAIQQTRTHLDTYRFDLASQALYEFVWHEFCDWYLELSKPVLMSESATAAEKLGTRKTLLTVLDSILKLMHPMMPFITEEIWQQLKAYVPHDSESIMLEAFPIIDNNVINNDIEEEVSWLQQVIIGIRNIRGEMNISPAKQFSVFISKASELEKQRFAANKTFLMTLAKLSSIENLEAELTEPSSTALIGEMELLIPLKGLVDVAQESARLSKEIEKLSKDAKRYQAKLGNAKFVDNAPADVVVEEKRRLAEVETAIAKLQTKLEQIQAL